MREIRVDARRGPTVSPWNLRPSEAKALDALLVTGSTKRAAAMLGISQKSIEPALQSARDRLGVDTTIHAVIKWHDWRKAESRTVRAEDAAGDGVALRALHGVGELERAMFQR